MIKRHPELQGVYIVLALQIYDPCPRTDKRSVKSADYFPRRKVMDMAGITADVTCIIMEWCVGRGARRED